MKTTTIKYKKTTVIIGVLVLVLALAAAITVVTLANANEPQTPVETESREISTVSYDISPVEQSQIKSEAEQSGVASTDESKQNVSDDEFEEPTGGYIGCIHFEHYHTFDGFLIDYVGEEAFLEWVIIAEKVNVIDECSSGDANIFEFIRHFNIPRKDFEGVYYEKGLYDSYYYKGLD